MNMQQIMQQAQRMQREISKSKEEIDNTVFTHEMSFVSVEMYGSKKIKSIKINRESISSDEIADAEDLITVAINECLKKIESATKEKLGKYGSALDGLM